VATSAGITTGLALKLAGLSRRYGERVALKPIDLTVAPGTAIALMGANGSGKTTLLRLIAGRDVASTGTATLDGAPYSEDDEWIRRAVGIVAEDVAFYPDLSVREHLWLIASAHGAGSQIEAVSDAALARVWLTDHADALPKELSSGQQQALLVATMLVRPRRMLLLDEPERRLDPDARARLAEILAAERGSGVTLVFATHHEELAKRVADHVVVLHDGAVVVIGSPDKIDFGEAHGQ
jgi:ABC-type multidrug transport system ATPase subunit